MARKIAVSCIVALLALGAAWWLTGGRGDGRGAERPERGQRLPGSVQPAQAKRVAGKSGARATRREAAENPASRAGEADVVEASSTAAAVAARENVGADEDERLAKEFDSLVDSWTKPSGKGASMEDVQRFAESFRKVPRSRKRECLQRALNLVPDENVMLFAGVLMDKTQEKEFLEMVYNDVLNRDEDVKSPILQQIFKDREHPCWVDTAWILDVTGKIPAANATRK